MSFSITGIESKAQQHAANLEEVRTEVFTEVTSSIQIAQAKQKPQACTNRISAGRPRPSKKHRNLGRRGSRRNGGKGLYRLKNECGKIMRKKYNSAQLKIYNERQGTSSR